MDKLVKKIKDELARIPGSGEANDEAEVNEALDQIDSSLDMLKGHPHSGGIHEALSKAVDHLDEDSENEEGAVSKILHRLTDELNEYEDAHPGATLLVSRLANALAVYGL